VLINDERLMCSRRMEPSVPKHCKEADAQDNRPLFP
jgi:hypothetical protein